MREVGREALQHFIDEASASYRRQLLGQLLWRSWLESQGSALPYATGLQALEPISPRTETELRP